MKHQVSKIAVAALALFGAHAAQAVVITTGDLGHYTITIDTSFFEATNVHAEAGGLTLGTSGYGVMAASDGARVGQFARNYGYADGETASPVLITINAASGYVVTGVTESLIGTAYSNASVAGSVAKGILNYDSRWKSSANGGETFASNDGPLQALVIDAVGVSPETLRDFNLKLTTSFGNLAGATVTMSDASLTMLAKVIGGGAVSDFGLDKYKLNVTVSAVPEPESLALLLAGVGVVGLTMNRRKQQA
ncbi:MAG: hypothetical protein RI907_3343 [Pseudomonadota bacterium]|jgi:hypothetical protein